MRRLSEILALSVLVTFTACDDVGRDLSEERADGAYRTAMDDYRSGRLKEAVAGLSRVCSRAPTNVSARFQLACLLQDSEKDYLGAFCAYREYLLQSPDSDKARLARDRMAACEREMAKALAAKYASESEREALRSAQEARAAQTKASAENEKLKAQVEELSQSLTAARQENDRLKSLMRDEAKEEAAATPVTADEIATAKALFEKEEPAASAATDEVSAALSLLEEDATTEAPLQQKADAKERRDAARAAKAQPRPPLYPHETRPETYVVQEGDTLYKLAVRFYGRASAWSRIRDANRTVISNDGRLRTGCRIVLPKGE